MPHAPLGIIEGFFGPPYGWDDRRMMVERLAGQGFSRWVYAPKSDTLLRDDWRQPHPDKEAREFRSFSDFCRAHRHDFGVGLSPLGLNAGYGAEDRAALKQKTNRLLDLDIDHLSLLFDDMRGDFPDLAKVQIEIGHDVLDWLGGKELTLCPSYYSDDPILDKVFGQRPAGYLEELGRGLDQSIGLFWTGEKVCSPGYTTDHLMATATTIGRKASLWDNYPVNDGPRMAKKLHLRPFHNRSECNEATLARHLINPMSQPNLGMIPLLTLGDGGRGSDEERIRAAALGLFGEPLAGLLAEDMAFVHDTGLNGTEEQLARLRTRYTGIDHPAARELIAWLDGAYAFNLEEVQTG